MQKFLDHAISGVRKWEGCEKCEGYEKTGRVNVKNTRCPPISVRFLTKKQKKKKQVGTSNTLVLEALALISGIINFLCNIFVLRKL